MKVMAAILLHIVVTMTKCKQGLKGNQFSEQVRTKYTEHIYYDVENDQYDGQMNVKGAVQRNRKMVQALAKN